MYRFTKLAVRSARFYTISIVSLLIFSSLSLSVVQAETEELKIAAVLGLTGDATYHGNAIMRGAQIAQEELLEGGRKVSIRYEDDQTNPAKTVTAIRSLTSRGYSLFLGPTWSFQFKAAIPLLEKANAVSMGPAASSYINGGASKYVFNICPPRTLQTKPVAQWLKANPHKKALILTPNGDWGEVHREVYRKALKSQNITISKEEQFDYWIDASSLKSILLREAKKNIDIVMLTGATKNNADLIQARNQLKLDLTIFGTNDIEDAIALGLLSKEEVSNRVYRVGLSRSDKFKKLYKKRFNEAPPTYADRSYDAIMALAEAQSQTDGSNEAIREYLRKEISFDGMSGKISFDENGDLEDAGYEVVDVSKLYQ